VQVDHHEHRERVFDGGEYVFGEPVFVARPNSNVEGDGVLLSVGSPARGNRSALVVLDAQTLAPLAHAHVDLPLPLGFHGGFVLER
jgi:carotenoid cleavage dioxygenase-like enzyme